MGEKYLLTPHDLQQKGFVSLKYTGFGKYASIYDRVPYILYLLCYYPMLCELLWCDYAISLVEAAKHGSAAYPGWSMVVHLLRLGHHLPLQSQGYADSATS